MSIATQITRLNTNIDNMKITKQEIKDAVNSDFDIIANEQIEGYADLIKNGTDLYKDYIPKTSTEQATEITVDDAMNYSRNGLELFGNTEQTQYTGKNLFNVSNSSAYWQTLGFRLIDNIIKISIGDGNGGLSQGVQGEYTNYNFDTNKSYCFSITPKSGDLIFKESTSSKWLQVTIYIKYSDDTTSANNVRITHGMNIASVLVTFTANKTPVAFAIGRYSPVGSLQTNQEAEYYVQLEEGTEATDWEPFVGGQPSPSPDFPQPIHVVTGNNTIGVQGRNLFDENILKQETNYNTYNSTTQLWTTNNGGSYGRSILYNATGYASRNINKLVPLTSAGTYTLKLYDFINNTSYASALELVLFDNEGSKISQTTQSSNFIKFTIDRPCYMDLCRRNNSGTISFSKVMLVQGNYIEQTLPDYVPYVEPQKYPINLGSLELCKIGDYQDYLYKENGNWYKYGAIEKYVYNNDLTYNATSENYISVLTPVLNIGILSQSQLRYISYCNMFTTYSINNTGFNGTTNSHKIRINISFSYATTLAEVKALCEEKSLSIYYGAETPTSTQITDETLISQLDAIYEHFKLLKGTNHITVTAADLAPYMKLSYMQDLPTKLNNLASRIELLEE